MDLRRHMPEELWCVLENSIAVMSLLGGPQDQAQVASIGLLWKGFRAFFEMLSSPLSLFPKN
jgi:hypothetical protein